MKPKRIIHLGILALFAPAGIATSNAEAPAKSAKDSTAEIAELRAELAKNAQTLREQAEQIATLGTAVAPVAETGPWKRGMKPRTPEEIFAEAAGLPDMEDVTWRMKAGLSSRQAIQAAVAQIESNEIAAATASAAEANTQKPR
jgi:hypothetical protein